jgi:glycine cleavage system H protein
VKAVSELFSPVTGEVIEVNATLAGQPETVNKDPHGGAWMIVVRITDPASLGGLMDAKAYETFVESEAK